MSDQAPSTTTLGVVESKICSRKVISESVVLKIMCRCQLIVFCLFVCFQPPYVCPFQTADYTIEVQQNGTNKTFTHGPVNYSPATMREMVDITDVLCGMLISCLVFKVTGTCL